MKRPGLKSVFSAFLFFIILLINLYANIEPGDPASPADLLSEMQQFSRHTCRFTVCSGWTDAGVYHARIIQCVVCGRATAESAVHSFESRSDWTDNGANHYRTYNCSQCGRPETEVADHGYNTWSAWSSTGAYHTRVRHCSVCGHLESETVAHDFSAWSAWQDLGDNHYRFRVCTVCGKKETETSAHSYGGWSVWSVYDPDKAQHIRTRACLFCRHTDREAAAGLADDISAYQAARNRNKQHFAER